MLFPAFVWASVALCGLSLAAPYNAHTRRSITILDDDLKSSGLCETTPGVKQYSGYFSLGEDLHMWFWFFEARHNPKTAPLVVWFNGGPGASSMLGLFQSNGPCHFPNGSDQPVLNEFSFNEAANMLYIDQPIGAGFSYGNEELAAQINSTDTAIPYIWEFLQAFYSTFDEFTGRPTGIFTASYGGHYGPALVRYIQQKNKVSKCKRINLLGLAINDGLFDYAIQEKAMADYLYQNEIIGEDTYNSTIEAYETNCVPALEICRTTETNSDCSAADDACWSSVEGPLSDMIDYVYDIRGTGFAPPTTYVDWLNEGLVNSTNITVAEAIGAQTPYKASNDDIFSRFIGTGDTARSSIPALSEVAKSGDVPILIWVGDKDFLCNYIGIRQIAESIEFDGQDVFTTQELADWKIPGDEKIYGRYKVQGKLSYLEVYDAGHSLMYSQPKAALAAFKQFIGTGTVSSA